MHFPVWCAIHNAKEGYAG